MWIPFKDNHQETVATKCLTVWIQSLLLWPHTPCNPQHAPTCFTERQVHPMDENTCSYICCSEFWVKYFVLCVWTAFTIREQTPTFYLNDRAAADVRLTDNSQPYEKHKHGPLVCMLRVSPAGWLWLHACLDWVGAVKGVVALKWRERHRHRHRHRRDIPAGTLLFMWLYSTAPRAP